MPGVLKVLAVCSINGGKVNPFITEQVNALQKLGVETDYFFIRKKGLSGYLSHLGSLRKKIRENNYQVLHAHYGLSGLLAIFQNKLPVVVTYHGSDINQKKVLLFSRIAARRAQYNIVVEESFKKKLGIQHNTEVIPCGIDNDIFFPIPRETARKILSIPPTQPLVLFSSSFRNPVKNYPLAKAAVEQVPGALLWELQGYDRSEVNLLMNAADALLLTSFTEGSPQVIKEALCCNLPIVSVPVGDVVKMIGEIPGNYIVSPDATEISGALKTVLQENRRTKGHEKAQSLGNDVVANKIKRIYQSIA